MTNDEIDLLLKLWSAGDRRRVAREILARTTPEALRLAHRLAREFARRKGDYLGSQEAGKLFDAVDAEYADLTATLTN